jgi:hypothetical protein
MFFPQTVHFSFSKNCISPHRALVQRIINPAPQTSHLSPANVCRLQVGHAT